jgi:hypothetical protein
VPPSVTPKGLIGVRVVKPQVITQSAKVRGITKTNSVSFLKKTQRGVIPSTSFPSVKILKKPAINSAAAKKLAPISLVVKRWYSLKMTGDQLNDYLHQL